MEKTQCPKFERCNAALCPHDITPGMLWYADTEVCRSADAPRWVKTQRKIAKLNPDPHRWFTKKMLESIRRVDKGILGIESVGYSAAKEKEWIASRGDRHNEKSKEMSLAS